MARRLWTYEELLLTFNLYMKLPFGRIHYRNPEVIALGQLLGRSPSAIAIRLTNFASLDPDLRQRGIRGMGNGGKLCQAIWEAYHDAPEATLMQSEQLLLSRNGSFPPSATDGTPEIPAVGGEDRQGLSTHRIGQRLFRQIVLANYADKCVLTGMDIPELLIASHIVPWAERAEHRLDPSNGLCLSALYDRAFDVGLISFTTSYQCELSPELMQRAPRDYFATHFEPIAGKTLRMPEKYPPKQEFLRWHYEHIFRH